MDEAQTLPQAFLLRAAERPEAVALRQKEFGIWREFTWAASREQVRNLALGLIALGVGRGDKVCTIGDNDRHHLWAYLALQAVGAVHVGLFTDAIPSELSYIIDHSDATFVLAKDQEQVDKLLDSRAALPKVRRVIYWDDRGLWEYDDPWLASYGDVQALGRELAEREPDRFETEAALGRAGDLAMFCYTSGTTGRPKGVMLSHGNVLAATALYQAVDPRRPDDNHVSFMPMAWIAEPILGIAAHVTVGLILNFPEEPETVRQNVREIAPQTLFYSSRLWDSLVASVQMQMNDATWINRKLYDAFLPAGYAAADARLHGRAPGVGLRLRATIGNRLVFAPLRDQLGMSRVRHAYTAGSALSPDAMRFFHALGINLKQIYGSTEVSGPATIHRDGQVKAGTVGPPAPGIDIRLAPDGEIQIAGPTVMQGYYRDPAATARDILLDDHGRRWFRTGDAGAFDADGHLVYLDRVSDMLELAGGERFSPQFIEGRLKFSPYIRDAMAVGGETREAVTALVVINFENAGQWAEKRRLPYTTYLDLSQKPEVYDLVGRAVAEVNESLLPAARVRRFVVMHKEFDADEAEMTRTRKLRRGYLTERYSAIIDALYNGASAVRVRAPVRYQDGSEGSVETDLRISGEW